jgi:diguanylate cyclase (GGDEF)-like protein/putative nucleotidyltransferase with HDIG domain
MGRLTDAARTDPLTELPNRVAMHETLERELARAKPEQRPVSVVVIDLDRFNRVNDQLGIKTGDDILRRIGSVLKESTRLIDTVARSGGEEFIVVMPETDQHRAFMMAEDLLRRLREYFASFDAELTASVGVATSPAHATDITGLIASCNKALQAAKALGRDRAVIYSPEVTQTLGALAGKHNVESQAQLATVLSLAEALDQRDSSTARHSQTVGALCELMAKQLGLPEARVERVRLAGILHDIGKIGVPDSILGKPSPLTPEEQAHMRRHPELGARILGSKELDDVRGWVLAHHERPDGTGYPKGLKGDEIPIEASILAVADAFEAMTSDRVYRASLGEDIARRELLDGAGTQFDADVVDALLTALKRESPLSVR